MDEISKLHVLQNGIPNKLKSRNWYNMVSHACAFFCGVLEIMPCKMDVVFKSMETKE